MKSNFLDLLHSGEKSISVTGLGYVGLPLALAFGKLFQVIAYDINEIRIGLLQENNDVDGEVDKSQFENKNVFFTAKAADLRKAHFHLICVPTDIDNYMIPDLDPLKKASQVVGENLKKGDYVIYESTVYPGCTEEVCLPILEEYSGLTRSRDFKVGYSPERVVPGSKEKSLDEIVKIVSGEDTEALDTISEIYQTILKKDVYRVSTIRIAEAAKVIENTQRYLNISFINELSMLLNKMNIDTNEVLEAAATKWNFHPYSPGLVGGHCISVDPFYLLYKANEIGFDSQLITAGARINDSMPSFIAKSLVQKLLSIDKHPNRCKVLVMGLAFKENIRDIRNSKVFDLIRELEDYFIHVEAYDPEVDEEKIIKTQRIKMKKILADDYDAIIVAVSHDRFLKIEENEFLGMMDDENPILFDLKGIYKEFKNLIYWSL